LRFHVCKSSFLCRFELYPFRILKRIYERQQFRRLRDPHFFHQGEVTADHVVVRFASEDITESKHPADDFGIVGAVIPVFRRIQVPADVVAAVTGAPCFKQRLHAPRIGKRSADRFQIPEEAVFFAVFQRNDLLFPEMIRAEFQSIDTQFVEQGFDEIAILPESVFPEVFRKVKVPGRINDRSSVPVFDPFRTMGVTVEDKCGSGLGKFPAEFLQTR